VLLPQAPQVCVEGWCNTTCPLNKDSEHVESTQLMLIVPVVIILTLCHNMCVWLGDVMQHVGGTQIHNMLHWSNEAHTTCHPVSLLVLFCNLCMWHGDFMQHVICTQIMCIEVTSTNTDTSVAVEAHTTCHPVSLSVSQHVHIARWCYITCHPL
jgi:hypothetical protein